MCLRSDRADHFLASENQRGTGSWLDGILRFSFRKTEISDLRSLLQSQQGRAGKGTGASAQGLVLFTPSPEARG